MQSISYIIAQRLANYPEPHTEYNSGAYQELCEVMRIVSDAEHDVNQSMHDSALLVRDTCAGMVEKLASEFLPELSDDPKNMAGFSLLMGMISSGIRSINVDEVLRIGRG